MGNFRAVIISVMNIVGRPVTATIWIFLLVSSVSPQSPIKFCELLRNPEPYNGKTVKVRATWVYGFERSYLHCLDCDDQVWLDTSELDEQSEKTVQHTAKGAGIVNVDVEGVFQAGGSFGHLNGYKYQMKARTLSNLAVLSKGMKAREKELAIERNFACGGTNPR